MILHIKKYEVILRFEKQFTFIFILFLIISSFAEERPNEWAQPIVIEGLPNLHQVTPTIYRSAQPSSKGMFMAESLGIKTVINLCYNNDFITAKGTNLIIKQFPMCASWIKKKKMSNALEALRDEKNHPVLVHCKHGADRTGLLMGLYRVTAQGWENRKALKELKEGGYNHHKRFFNIRRYLKKFKVEN